MLAHGSEEGGRFTRGDVGRLAIAALALVAVIGGILGADLGPPPVRLEVGDLVPADTTVWLEDEPGRPSA